MLHIKKSLLLAVATAAFTLLATRPCAADLSPTVLILPDGYSAGAGFAVNASGQIAGSVYSADYGNRACRWTNGVPTVLEPLYGDQSSQPNSINGAGVVVGYSSDSDNNHRAVRWVAGSTVPEDLGVLSNEPRSEALAINDLGQILCQSGDRWFLWEENYGRTEITMPNGMGIEVAGTGLWGGGGQLSENGSVVGQGQFGHWDENQFPPQWVVDTYYPVLWEKTGPFPTVTPLPLGPNGGEVYAISPGGKVAGLAYDSGYFVYDSITSAMSYVDTAPSADPNLGYFVHGVSAVNDQGMVVFALRVYDISSDPWTYLENQLWAWQGGEWTQVPITSLLAPGESLNYLIAALNANGQMAGTIMDTSNDYVAFAWSSAMGIQALLGPSAGYESLAIDLNDAGLVVGGAQGSSSDDIVPLVWNLPTTMDVSVVSVVRNGKTVTVTVSLTNATAETVRNVMVTAAQLNGSATNSILPLSYGAIKPGASKQCKLQFKLVATGSQPLSVSGTCSVGNFSKSIDVTVP